MKLIIQLCLFAFLSCSVSAAKLRERVNNSEVIAIVAVTNTAATTHTNAVGEVVVSFSCDATLLRTMKGTLPLNFQVKGDAAPAYVSQSSIPNHFVLFLKRSGAIYSLSDTDGIVPIFGQENRRTEFFGRTAHRWRNLKSGYGKR